MEQGHVASPEASAGKNTQRAGLGNMQHCQGSHVPGSQQETEGENHHEDPLKPTTLSISL